MKDSYLGESIKNLGFGLMRLPMNGDDVDMIQTQKMVDRFIQEGYTYFDTAYPYIGGKSELAVKELLTTRYPRESYQLASKMPVWACKDYSDFQKYFDIQLERTGAKYFDYYLLHALDRDRIDAMDKINAWDFMKELKEKSLAKHIGFSFHDTADVLDDVLTKHPEVEFVQLQINYADWEDEKVQSRLCYEVTRKHNKSVIVMEPVKGGSLAGLTPTVQNMFKSKQENMSIASWAMRYAASLDGVITVLSGMSNEEQMNDNLKTISDFRALDSEEKIVLEKAIEEMKKIDTIPCTACKYCVDDCPSKINIPGILKAFNTYKIYQQESGVLSHYKWITSESGKASDCIACGLCEGHCPQHINIIESLADFSEIFDK